MAQCAGTTQKGERCRREAREGSTYCAIHFDREARAKAEGEPRPEAARGERTPWTSDDTFRALIGIGVIAAIVIFRIRR